MARNNTTPPSFSTMMRQNSTLMVSRRLAIFLVDPIAWRVKNASVQPLYIPRIVLRAATTVWVSSNVYLHAHPFQTTTKSALGATRHSTTTYAMLITRRRTSVHGRSNAQSVVRFGIWRNSEGGERMLMYVRRIQFCPKMFVFFVLNVQNFCICLYICPKCS